MSHTRELYSYSGACPRGHQHPAQRGAGGMDYWRTERTHGCPALAGPVRRWNKVNAIYMENLVSMRPRSGKEFSLSQTKLSNVSHYYFLPSLLPFLNLLWREGCRNQRCPPPHFLRHSPRWGIRWSKKKIFFKGFTSSSESFAKEKHLQLDMRLKYETGL